MNRPKLVWLLLGLHTTNAQVSFDPVNIFTGGVVGSIEQITDIGQAIAFDNGEDELKAGAIQFDMRNAAKLERVELTCFVRTLEEGDGTDVLLELNSFEGNGEIRRDVRIGPTTLIQEIDTMELVVGTEIKFVVTNAYNMAIDESFEYLVFSTRFERSEAVTPTVSFGPCRLVDVIAEIRSGVAGIDSDVGDIKTDVGDIKTDVGDIKSDIADIKRENTELKEMLTMLMMQCSASCEDDDSGMGKKKRQKG